jgi:hypothetical protein
MKMFTSPANSASFVLLEQSRQSLQNDLLIYLFRKYWSLQFRPCAF